MSAHTPGPWRTTTRRGSWDWVVYQEADPNVEICQPFHDDTEFNETGEANARLIAAAPELLDALKQVVADIREYERVNNLAPNPGRKDCWQSVSVAEAVIAKVMQ